MHKLQNNESENEWQEGKNLEQVIMAYTEILSQYLSTRNTEEKYKNKTLVTAAINPTEN